MRPGAQVTEEGVRFMVWAPRAESVELYLAPAGAALPRAGDNPDGDSVGGGRRIRMEKGPRGVYTVTVPETGAGARYGFCADGGSVYPDPAGSFQPDGVHGLSAVVDHRYEWDDQAFRPVSLSDLVLYEIHVGTFTPEGTFAAAAERMAELAALGITGIEIMPVSQFPGERNWGYDGAYIYAAQNSYGGPAGFAQLVNKAHIHGLSVYLDLVFNHMGPEGNYSGQFGDYFTGKYTTPWGDAVNVDGKGSDQVRTYFLGAAEQWLRDYHVDGFRLDAVHEIHDESGVPFLRQVAELANAVSQDTGKRRHVIAESDLNERRLVCSPSANGMGMDAAWADDFHHAVHAYLTGERNGYYQDFGASRRIALALEDGWSYNWEYSASRERHHGTSPAGLPTTSFVFCTQNHDQVGNRMLGERLPTLAGREAEQAARVLLLLAPYIPLLFMGQEYGEQRPFLYIIDHSDPGLVRATREGRKREFAAFHREGEPPDPADSATAGRSVLDWDSRTEGEHNDDLELSRALLSLRGEYDCFRPSLAGGESGTRRRAFADGGLIGFKTEAAMYGGVVVVNLSGTPAGLASRELCTALGLPSLPRAALPGSEIFRHGEVSLLKEGTERERIELGPFSAWASVYKAHSAGSIGRTPSVS